MENTSGPKGEIVNLNLDSKTPGIDEGDMLSEV